MVTALRLPSSPARDIRSTQIRQKQVLSPSRASVNVRKQIFGLHPKPFAFNIWWVDGGHFFVNFEMAGVMQVQRDLSPYGGGDSPDVRGPVSDPPTRKQTNVYQNEVRLNTVKRLRSLIYLMSRHGGTSFHGLHEVLFAGLKAQVGRQCAQ